MGILGLRPARVWVIETDAEEAVHRQFRKLAKTKGGFVHENSLRACVMEVY